jgi:hypothetical protein
MDVKGVLVATLGKCARRGATISLDFLASTVRDESKPVMLRLQALEALANAALQPGAEAVVTALINLASSAANVAASHPLVFALLLPAVLVSAKSEGVAKALRDSAAWSQHVRNSDSPIHAPALYAKAPELARALALRCVEAILESADATVDTPVLRTFCALGSSIVRSIRSQAMSAGRRLATRVAPAALKFAITRKEPGSNSLTLLPFLDSAAPPPPAIVLQLVQVFAAPGISDRDLCLLCLALHHPAAQPRHPLMSVWALALKHAQRATAPIDALVPFLFSAEGLLSEANVSAAAAALRSVCCLQPAAALAVGDAAVASWQSAFAAVSERDVAIYRIAPDTLYEEPVLDGYVPEESESRQKKGADEEWAEQVRREIAAKKGGGAAAPVKETKKSKALQEAREKQLAVEATVRARVREIDVVASGLLRGLLALSTCDGARFYIEDVLPRVFPLVASVFASPLLGTLAQQVGIGLAKYVLTPLRNLRAVTVSTAARLARVQLQVQHELAAGGAEDDEDEAKRRQRAEALQQRERERALGQWTVSTIFEAIEKSPLSPSPGVLAVMFPLLALHSFFDAQSVAHALHVLEMHSTTAGELPRGAMATTLLAMLNTNEALAPRCSAAMVQLGKLFALSDVLRLAACYPTTVEVSGREALLRCLAVAPPVVAGDATDAAWTVVFIARHDRNSSIAALGLTLWKLGQLVLPDNAFMPLSKLLGNAHADMREAIAAAVVSAVLEQPGSVDPALAELPLRFAGGDECTKLGVASVVAQLGPCLDYPRLQRLLQWLLGAGPLVDKLETVRTAFTNAGAKLVEKNGASCVSELYELFNGRMSATVAVLSESTADEASEGRAAAAAPIDRDVRREDPAEVAQREAQYVR